MWSTVIRAKRKTVRSSSFVFAKLLFVKCVRRWPSNSFIVCCVCAREISRRYFAFCLFFETLTVCCCGGWPNAIWRVLLFFRYPYCFRFFFAGHIIGVLADQMMKSGWVLRRFTENYFSTQKNNCVQTSMYDIGIVWTEVASLAKRVRADQKKEEERKKKRAGQPYNRINTQWTSILLWLSIQLMKKQFHHNL